MPKATARATARTLPKPKPGRPVIRVPTAELESATVLLKDAGQIGAVRPKSEASSAATEGRVA